VREIKLLPTSLPLSLSLCEMFHRPIALIIAFSLVYCMHRCQSTLVARRPHMLTLLLYPFIHRFIQHIHTPCSMYFYNSDIKCFDISKLHAQPQSPFAIDFSIFCEGFLKFVRGCMQATKREKAAMRREYAKCETGAAKRDERHLTALPT
jgi:hypothetical protein